MYGKFRGALQTELEEISESGLTGWVIMTDYRSHALAPPGATSFVVTTTWHATWRSEL